MDAAPTFSIFAGDPFNRALARVRLGDGDRPHPLRATLALAALTWLPMFVATGWDGTWIGSTVRTSFLYDVACYAQNLGFLPLTIVAEVFIDGRMRAAVPHLREVVPADALAATRDRAVAWSRSRAATAVCVVLALLLSWAWAADEVTNGIPSWHTFVVGDAEGFTVAGWWATLVALPIYTFAWLRWVYKIAVWTAFLGQLACQELRLVAAHPDRTGGLGVLTSVQSSFAIILFGTGVLFSSAIYYKVLFEGTPVGNYNVWGPTIGYVILAPGVFLAPLFLFTGALIRARDEALLRYHAVAVEQARQLDGWLAEGGRLDTPAPSAVADFHATWATVESMRIVPFDLRSLTELVTSAAAPFAPLLWIAQVPERWKPVLDLLSG